MWQVNETGFLGMTTQNTRLDGREKLFTQLKAGFPPEKFHRDKKHLSSGEFFEVILVYWDKGR
jgi:hypothetical protein